MKRINWKNLSLLVIDFILVIYLAVTLISVIKGAFIGVDGLLKMFIVSIFAEPITEEVVKIVCK